MQTHTANAELSEQDIEALLENLDNLSEEELAEVDQVVDELAARKANQAAHDDLLAFCKKMQPDYKVGAHHKILARLLMQLESGEKDRICVNIAPRHGKSRLVSTFYPAWFLGRNPAKKVMLVSHTADLAVDFGRDIRNLVASPDYKAVFPDVSLAVDSKSAGRWNTNHKGVFFACGVGSSLAGRGADLLVVDDPHSEQDVLNGNFEVFERAYQWFTYGALTRLMPNASVAVVQTRWHADDLTGRLVKDMVQNPETDQYEVVEFPAILEVEDAQTGQVIEKALWPEFYDLEALKRKRASMPQFQWNAQYQQNPTSEEAAIVKREWWQAWLKDEPPECEYIIMTLDAAAETHNRADFTGITTWGVFFNEEVDAHNVILLNSVKDRFEFPELKRKALQEYGLWEPDSFIVEKKSAGTALYQELRRMGMPVQEYTPHRGSGDKLARLNSVTDIVASGLCWVPRTRWAEELVDEVAAFPFGSHDDLVDCTTMALMRFRQGGFIRLPSDEVDDPLPFRRREAYY
jgi:predicted phage terminase large subunit-like protein